VLASLAQWLIVAILKRYTGKSVSVNMPRNGVMIVHREDLGSEISSRIFDKQGDIDPEAHVSGPSDCLIADGDFQPRHQ
jgi:hypothetical protein